MGRKLTGNDQLRAPGEVITLRMSRQLREDLDDLRVYFAAVTGAPEPLSLSHTIRAAVHCARTFRARIAAQCVRKDINDGVSSA